MNRRDGRVCSRSGVLLHYRGESYRGWRNECLIGTQRSPQATRSRHTVGTTGGVMPSSPSRSYELAAHSPSAQRGSTNRPIAAMLDPRTRILLEAPIAPTLLRLAVPNILVLVAQAAEAWLRLISSASWVSSRWRALHSFSRS